MKPFSQRKLIAAAIATAITTAFVGISATAIAQGMDHSAHTPPEPQAQPTAQRGTPGAMDPARMAEMQKKMADHHAARMDRLKAELKISAAQEPAWNAFVARTAHEPRKPVAAAEDWSQLTTPQRLDKMQALKAERDAKMSQRIDATKSFYAVLTPEQQKVFDAGGMHRMGMKGEHRMGGKGHHGMGGMGGGMGCEGGPMPGARS